MEGFCRWSRACQGRTSQWNAVLATALLLVGTAYAQDPTQNAAPQDNVDIIGPTPAGIGYAGAPHMQQNEPDGVESLVFPGHLAIGVNDYRGVNDPALGEAFPGLAVSSDNGQSWMSWLVPGNLTDTPNIGQKGGADPNLEIAPYIMYYNFIAFWRDGSNPPGIYTARFYEPNREVGIPFRHLDIHEARIGTKNKFLDKPAFKLALFNHADGRPDLEIPIPAFVDPRNPANSHDPYVLRTPAHRLHLCYSVFVGNDNNDGTIIECVASDDGGVTWPIKNKLSESVGINQGTSIATRNFGKDVVVTWVRFPDNNESAALMYVYSTDFGETYSFPEVVTEYCAFNQATGAARFRTNALPTVVSTGDDFAVYVAARNDATEECVVRGKGSKPDVPRMSDVMLADDFDNFDEGTNADGSRMKDGKVRTSLNFSRIMMIRSTGGNNLRWGDPVAVDPQEDVNEFGQIVRKRFHQFMPACDAVAGVETCTFTDNRLDKFNTIMQGLPARPFVEDMVLHLQPGLPVDDPNAKVTPILLPAGAYEGVPDPSQLPPTSNNLPLRSTLEQFVFQVENGVVRPYLVDQDSYYVADPGDPNTTLSPSARVTRFATRQKPGAPIGTTQQVEWDYGNARMFQRGKASFNGDYSAMFGAGMRQRQDPVTGELNWIPNQDFPDPLLDIFPSLEPELHTAWTSNHKARGKLFYTGCDTWDEENQMWMSGLGCASTYTEPDGKLYPLEGEDGGNDGELLSCSAAFAQGFARAPLTRNQTVMTAALTPDLSARVVSAIKPADGSRSTFVVELRNGSGTDRAVNVSIPAGFEVSFGADEADSLLSIPVVVPRNSGNVRTVFDFGDLASDPDLPPTIIAVVTDAVTGATLARVPLLRQSLTTPPLENVQSNPNPQDPTGSVVDLTSDGEFYNLILQREFGLDPSVATLDLESFDLENTAELFELENLDFASFDLENKLIFFDLENFELENTDLRNDLYQAFDLENLVINYAEDGENTDRLLYFDLENFELENFELENFDLENFELENFELENFELENFELENFELENESIYASGIANFELENFELENTAPGDDFTEVSWRADSSSNTTTGVDIQPIFTPELAQSLVDSGATVLLTVRKGYLVPTVAFAGTLQSCAAEIVVDNNLLFAAVLSEDQILGAQFFGSIADPVPSRPDTPGFLVPPDGNIVISMRIVNPPVGPDEINANMGVAIFAQSGDVLNCDLELPGDEIDNLCEVSFTAPDTTPPVITLNGSATDSVDQGALYVDPGAIATDNTDGDISASIVVTGWDLDSSIAGTYFLDYNVADAAGNNADTVTRTVNVLDTEAPVISLLGEASVTVNQGVLYVDAGATATDTFDGNLTTEIAVTGLPIDTGTPGVYEVDYDVSDAAGNPAATVTRTVTVLDTVAPVISVLGANPIVVEAGQPYVEPDPAFSVIDTGDPDVAVIVDTSAVNTAVVGSYTVTYDATDDVGNVATTVTRTVLVEDNSVPVIIGFPPTPTTEPSGDPILLPLGDTEIQVSWPISATDPNPGLTAYCDIGLEPVTTRIYPDSFEVSDGTVTFAFDYIFDPGTTNINCTVMDQGGNTSSGFFTVYVEDIPIIDPDSIPDPFVIPANDPAGYVGPTAVLWDPVVANDLVDGQITAVCTPTQDLALGPNTIRCDATDSKGNTSPAVTFTVTVADLAGPVVTVLADPYVVPTIEASATVTGDELKANVTAVDVVDGPITDPMQFSCTVNGAASATLAVGIHENAGSCTVTDSAGNVSVAAVFDIEIDFEYDFTLIVPNGNKRAGSVLPLDFYYAFPDSGERVDSSGFAIDISWFGPYTGNACTGTNTGAGDGSEANDAGNSSFRWSLSQLLWQYSWQTPGTPGFYELVVSPPGSQQSVECIRLR